MRIHLICAAFPPFGKGGGPVSSELIARALVSARHEVEVLTVSEAPYEDNRGGYWVRTIGSPNIYANYWRPNASWKKLVWHALENFNPVALVRVWRRLRGFRPDLVMTVSIENINVATWIATKCLRLPLVHFLQSYFVICWRGSLYRNNANCENLCTNCRLFSVGKRLSSRCVDAIVGETEFVNSMHIEAGVFRNARRYVIPGPADSGDAAVFRLRAARSQGAPLTIGYIGNISREKGVATLARTATRLFGTHGGGIRFRIAGSGADEYVAEIRSQFPAATTEFIGWTDASEFYRTVDAVVVPSLWREPFGRVSVEPLAYGVPVIVARSGGLPENVEDGVSGMIFSPDDDAELAQHLAQLFSDRPLLEKLSKGALVRAKMYEFSRFANSLDRLAKEVGPKGQ
jgi:glycosyltransferase involved in cell wall biosynthesis